MNNKWILAVCTTLLVISGCNSASEQKKEALNMTSDMENIMPVSIKTDTFDQQKAVETVLKDYPEFPLAGETKEIETITGGPAPGSRVTGTLATRVDNSPESETYIVTLSKQWNLTINDKELVGVWKFKVSPYGTQLIESKDNTDLVQIVK